MEETVEVKQSTINTLKDVYSKFNKLDKLELNSKQIFNLRRKIKQEKLDGYDNKLRTITLYTHSNNEYLKIYINSLYTQYFPQES